MPERVWVVTATAVGNGVVTAWDAWAAGLLKLFAFDDHCPDAVAYVLESRLLAAEARVREVEKGQQQEGPMSNGRNADGTYNVCIHYDPKTDEYESMKMVPASDLDTLRADLAALVEQYDDVRDALLDCVKQMEDAAHLLEFFPDDYGDAINTARAVLARHQEGV